MTKAYESMTNENDAAKAAQGQSPTGNDNGVAAAIASANAEPSTEMTLDQRVDELLGQRLDSYGRQVKQTIDREQGRAQQFYGDKLKEDRNELAEFMGDLTQVLDPEQQQVLDELRESRRQSSIDDRLTRIEQGKLPAAAAAPAAAMSENEANVLYETVEGLIEATGLSNIQPSDAAVWKGYSADMPLQQAVSLARKNIKAMRTAPTPAVTSTATPAATPPSTAGADSIPAQDYNSLSDLAAAFRDRNINSTEFTRIGREEGWLR